MCQQLPSPVPARSLVVIGRVKVDFAGEIDNRKLLAMAHKVFECRDDRLLLIAVLTELPRFFDEGFVQFEVRCRRAFSSTTHLSAANLTRDSRECQISLANQEIFTTKTPRAWDVRPTSQARMLKAARNSTPVRPITTQWGLNVTRYCVDLLFC
jgi:hypothetical protein